jgi:hypothetical protein
MQLRPSPCVLVHTQRRSSAWLRAVLGMVPLVRLSVREPWEVFEALAGGGFDLLVSEAYGDGEEAFRLAAMVRGAGEATPILLVGDHIPFTLRQRARRLPAVSCLDWRHALLCG